MKKLPVMTTHPIPHKHSCIPAIPGRYHHISLSKELNGEGVPSSQMLTLLAQYNATLQMQIY